MMVQRRQNCGQCTKGQFDSSYVYIGYGRLLICLAYADLTNCRANEMENVFRNSKPSEFLGKALN